MSDLLVPRLIHRNPDVAILDGPPAEAVARECGFADDLHRRAQAKIAATGGPCRVVALFVCGDNIVGAVYCHGFARSTDNGLICCHGRCTQPEHLPMVMRRVADFLACVVPRPFIGSEVN
jgi:hypothetical protein